MVDLECKVGQHKVVMRKVVCALDINVLSSYSLHEQGWEIRLGTLKVSGLHHKKVKFPLKISDRAWWLEVQVLKSHGNKSRRRNDKGPQDMEIDCIKNVTTDLSAKACQTKDVLTKVDHPLSSAKTSESYVSDSSAETKVSSIPHVSCKENVGSSEESFLLLSQWVRIPRDDHATNSWLSPNKVKVALGPDCDLSPHPVRAVPPDISIPYIDMLLGPQKPARGQSKQTTKQEESNTLPALEEVLVTLRLQVDSCGPSDVSALIQILLGGTRIRCRNHHLLDPSSARSL